MPKRPTSLTAAAGEHYVAYKLSALGFPVALTRGGSPTVDLMVGDISGDDAIMIQVKTSNWARRVYKRKIEQNHWEWDIGKKAMTLRSPNVFYAFVDLRWNSGKDPAVFIVPSEIVAAPLREGWSRYMHWITDEHQQRYLDRWDLITERLGSSPVD